MKKKAQFKYKKKAIIWFFLISFFCFTIFLFFIFIFLQSLNFSISSKFALKYKDQEKILQENTKLKAELEIFKNEKKIIDFLENQNKILEEKLNFSKENQKDRKIFNIIFPANSNIFSSFLLYDPKEMIKPGDIVFSAKNFIVGKIDQKFFNLAKVKLFSYLGEKNNFFISENGEIKIEAEGIGDGLNVIRVKIPRDIEFEDKEKIYLHYKNNTSYIAGYLTDIEFDIQDTEKTLFFKSFVNPNLLSFLEVEPENNFSKNE